MTPENLQPCPHNHSPYEYPEHCICLCQMCSARRLRVTMREEQKFHMIEHIANCKKCGWNL